MSDSAVETAADAIDLELHLGLSRSSNQPTKGGSSTAVSGLGSDLALFTAPSEIVEETEPDRAVKLESIGSSDTPPPTMADLGVPSDQDAEMESKDFAVEQPIIGNANANAPQIVQVQPLAIIPLPAPRGPRSARRRLDQPNPNPLAAMVNFVIAMVVPAWVREELLPLHGLPSDLPIYYVGEKILYESDLDSRQARLLIPADASFRLRLFLTNDEIMACGFNNTDRDAGLIDGVVRARPIAFDGIPVLAYVSGEYVASAELKLSKFHRGDITVINGKGYRHFMRERCVFVEGDVVEIWAFRRPPGDRLCFLIAKRIDA